MDADPVDGFGAALAASLAEGRLARLTLAKARGDGEGQTRVIVRPVEVGGRRQFAVTERYPTRDVTCNEDAERLLARVRGAVGRRFLSATLFTLDEDIHLDFNRRGQARLTRTPPSLSALPSPAHDRVKHRLLDVGLPFLRALGVTDADGKVRASMGGKWRQIGKFIEIVDHAVAMAGRQGPPGIRVVDFGCGKGYLTFALYEYLRATAGGEPRVLGVEQRPDLVEFCNRVARDLGLHGLSFVAGDILSTPVPEAEMVVALHACETATDDALYKAVQARAAVILCAPCCHKELRPQLVAPEVLRPMLKHGILLEREAELLTDGLRALALEAVGYHVQVFEFVSPEHTRKNTMILAVRRRPGPETGSWEPFLALKRLYGLRSLRLEGLLSEGTDPHRR